MHVYVQVCVSVYMVVVVRVCVCVLMCRICSGVGASIQDYTLFHTSDYDAALSKSPSCVQLGPSVNRCGL